MVREEPEPLSSRSVPLALRDRQGGVVGCVKISLTMMSLLRSVSLAVGSRIPRVCPHPGRRARCTARDSDTRDTRVPSGPSSAARRLGAEARLNVSRPGPLRTRTSHVAVRTVLRRDRSTMIYIPGDFTARNENYDDTGRPACAVRNTVNTRSLSCTASTSPAAGHIRSARARVAVCHGARVGGPQRTHTTKHNAADTRAGKRRRDACIA